ncbi:MAG: NADH-quinone oxidoreductase subunit L [Candidatus Dormibacteria bacterium]
MPAPYSLMWLIVLLPLAAFALIFGLTYENKRVSAWLGITAVAGADLVSIWTLISELNHPTHIQYGLGFFGDFMTFADVHFSFGILADPLSAMMIVVVCSVSLLVQVYSLEYMRGEEGFVRYYAFISLFTFSMLLLVLSTNYFQTYVGWELVGVCSYLLIGHYYKRPAAAAAAKKAFIVTRFGDFPFFVGIAYIFFRFHNHMNGAADLDFYTLGTLYKVGLVSQAGLFAMAMLIFSGAVGKSAQFPLHVWLPDAMEGPTPISALIHAATMVVAGVYLVARTYQLFAANPTSLVVVASLGALTSVMAAIWAVAQDDIKRIIAYSTLSHLGLMMFGLGVGAYSAAIFHLFTHAWFKALLFLGAGSVIHAVHTQNIWEMGGVGKRMKITAWTVGIASFSAAGIIPFSGFWSKDGIMASVFATANPVYIIAAILITFFSALYTFRLFFVVFAGEPARRRAFDPKKIHESGWYITVPLILLAIMAAFIGFTGIPGSKAGFGQFIFYGRHPEVEAINYIAIGVSLVVALIGVAVAALFYHPRYQRFSAPAFNKRYAAVYDWAHNKGYFDEIYHAMFINGLVLGTGRALQWFDKNIIDYFVDGLAEGYSAAAGRLRRLQSGRVQGYAVGLFGAVLVVAVLALIFGSSGPLSVVVGAGR